MDDNERVKLLKAIAENPSVLIDSITADIEEKRNRSIADANRYTVLLEGLKSINQMRQHWSTWLLGSIVFIVVFDSFFVILLGANLLSFQDGVVE